MSDEDINKPKGGTGGDPPGNPPGNSSGFSNVQAMNVKLPPFWDKNPQLWFVQVETQFTVCNVKADTSKYCLAVAALPSQVCECVYDILMDPPATGKYTALKTALIDRHALSEERRLEKLIERAELGDQKPSEVLRQMQRLAGDSVSDGALKKLWFRRLPKYMTVPLVAVEQNKDVTELMDLADRMYEASDAPEVNTLSNPKPGTSKQSNYSDPAYNELKQQIAKLESMIQNLNSRDRSGSRQSQHSRGSSSNRSRSRSHGKTWCWYHNKFGPRATKCTKPCGFKVKPPKSDSNNDNPNE